VSEIVKYPEHALVVVEQLGSCFGAGFAVLRECLSQLFDAGLGEGFDGYGKLERRAVPCGDVDLAAERDFRVGFFYFDDEEAFAVVDDVVVAHGRRRRE
jgi:hypothetical protein